MLAPHPATAASSPVAVVVGLDINGLGVVRSLAKAGIRIFAFDRIEAGPSAATRHCRVQRLGQLHGPTLVDALSAFRRTQNANPVLFLTQEETVRTVSAERAALMPHYRFAMPRHDMVERLMNKNEFIPLAAAAGLQQPHTVNIVPGAYDTSAVAALRFPVIVKPAERSATYAARFKKAYVLDDEPAVAAMCAAISGVAREVLVQEWIPGGDEQIFFCLQYVDRDGEVKAAFSGRKTVSWPPRVGGTAGCVAAPEVHDRINELTTRFFRHTGFVGMGGVEFKRDPRSGEFYLIEPTVCRTDYQAEIATLNGVNLPLSAYCSEVGATYTPGPATAAYGWRDPTASESGAVVPRQGLNADGSRWIMVDALWRWSDPMPWLVWIWRRIRRKVSRLRG